MPFSKEFQVGWGDLDANGHMRNTAYLDAAATTRMAFFQQNGFSVSRFRELSFGPVVFKDEVRYFKEMHLLQAYRVSLLLDGMNADASVFRLLNEVANEKGERVAVVISQGAWFDLGKRKVMPPPEDLLEVIRKLERTEGYSEIVKP